MRHRILLVCVLLLASCATKTMPSVNEGVRGVMAVTTKLVTASYPDMRGDFANVADTIETNLISEEVDLLAAGESVLVLFGAINDRLRLTPVPSVTVITALRVALPVVKQVVKMLFNKDFSVKMPDNVKTYLIAFSQGIRDGLGEPEVSMRTTERAIEGRDALKSYLKEWDKAVEEIRR